MRASKTSQSGFTLVELSIVLLIIALIIGGVLVGRDLIHSAELRSTISDFNAHKAAIYTFKARYNALPGDMRNATQFWKAGSGAACDPDNVTPDLSDGTCNGSANKVVGAFICGASTADPCYELYTFWQQLSLAGLVKGTFGADTSTFSVLEDYEAAIPPSKINQRWFWLPFYSGGSGTLNTAFPATHNKNMFALGIPNLDLSTGNATGADAEYLDIKMDDGVPNKGSVTVHPATACTENPDGTATTNASPRARYRTDDDSLTPCFLFIEY